MVGLSKNVSNGKVTSGVTQTPKPYILWLIVQIVPNLSSVIRATFSPITW